MTKVYKGVRLFTKVIEVCFWQKFIHVYNIGTNIGLLLNTMLFVTIYAKNIIFFREST